VALHVTNRKGQPLGPPLVVRCERDTECERKGKKKKDSHSHSSLLARRVPSSESGDRKRKKEGREQLRPAGKSAIPWRLPWGKAGGRGGQPRQGNSRREKKSPRLRAQERHRVSRRKGEGRGGGTGERAVFSTAPPPKPSATASVRKKGTLATRGKEPATIARNHTGAP